VGAVSASTPFDWLPDELVLGVFDYFDDTRKDLNLLASLSQRFNAMLRPRRADFMARELHRLLLVGKHVSVHAIVKSFQRRFNRDFSEITGGNLDKFLQGYPSYFGFCHRRVDRALSIMV
jgi:hypothetical protein